MSEIVVLSAIRLDENVDVIRHVAAEGYSDPETVKTAPNSTVPPGGGSWL